MEPDWFERRASQLAINQQLRCVEDPPIGSDQVQAEDRIKKRINELRSLSKTYNQQ